MNEDVLAAIFRLDETEALLAVEPLNGSCSLGDCPLGVCVCAALLTRQIKSRIWGESRQSGAL
jgi:hypothetical protein